MAPLRSKKSRSSESSANVLEFPAPPAMIAIKTGSPARTPTKSPAKKMMQISQAQKQALIDNLQLEITERARKLRAQYAHQAQSLRSRLEFRLNRIPMSLRKANMGELLAKYTEIVKPNEDRTSTVPESTEAIENIPTKKALPVSHAPNTKEAPQSSPARTRGTKRTSDGIDKENVPTTTSSQALSNPKKRTKLNPSTTTAGPATRTTSRAKIVPSTVLSPKSSNSRTLPHSPIRPALCSPQKSYLARPVSPLKPALPFNAIAATASLAGMVEKARTTTRAAATRKATNQKTATGPPVPATSRAKRGAEQAVVESGRTVSASSTASNLSTGTTVVNKGRKAPAPKKAPAKNMAISAAGKRVASKVEAPPAGRRVLRKRN